jgi:uncharacterized repeat protein (TIGR01451 family)
MGSIAITVDVGSTVADGSVLEQRATISADQTDVNPDDNTASVTSTVTRTTDVGVTVTADTATVTPGGVAGYQVTVTNHGPLAATAVTLTDVLPDQVTDPRDPTSCTFRGNTATCALGTLTPGASVTIPFRGTVPIGTAAGTKLVDTATVGHGEIDTVSVNNRDSATITVVAAPPPAHRPATQSTPQPIAVTGENLLAQLVDALALVALGVCFALLGRRRFRR